MNHQNCFSLALIILTLITFGYSQSKGINDIPKVYLDCWMCDHDYIKTEIAFVNYVTQRQESDIHILVTDQRTGSGGEEVTLTFIGQDSLLGLNDTLVYTTGPTDTRDQTREEMVRVLKLGLVPYISKTSIAKNLSISFIKPEEDVQILKDKWNNWVFSINLSSFANGEELQNSFMLYGSIIASRVTDDWKITLSNNGSYFENNFEFDDTSIKSIRRDYGFNASMIRSLTDHWSIGVFTGISSESFRNVEYDISLGPGLEYNIFPYSESTRRQLRWTYFIMPRYTDYIEETIYLKDKEKLFEQGLSVSLELVQPWGTVNTYLMGSHYFHDLQKNNFQVGGFISVNISKGLSLKFSGSISGIHDQIFLPRGGATIEEVLLQRKQLETQYNYMGSIGISYSFGSIYSNIVNPRFGFGSWGSEEGSDY